MAKKKDMNKIRDLIGIEPRWEVTRDSGINFKASEWHNEVRLELAIGMPFDFSVLLDLRKDEALVLAKQLIKASNDCKNNKGEEGQ